jgi:hypothetical protein
VAHVLVRHRMLIFVAKILWSTTHAPQNAYFGAPQKRFSLLVLTETPMCPREHLVIISYTTGFSIALERIGPLAAIIITVFYLLILYLFALPNTPKNPFASIYSEFLIKTTCQHLLLLVGFDTLIYRKYYDTPPILVGHQDYFLEPLPGSEALLKSGIGKGNRHFEYCFYFCLLFFILFCYGEFSIWVPIWENYYHCCGCG